MHIIANKGEINEDIGNNLQKMCYKFFNKQHKFSVLKKGAYKTILKASIGETLCLTKVYENPGVFRKMKALFKPSRARREYDAACTIAGRGIPTATPLCMAEMKQAGLVSKGLVVLPFLEEACELRDVFFQPSGFLPAVRRRISRDFGALTAWIFKEGIIQNDYSLNNFMVRKEQDERWQLYFIDFERVEIKEGLNRDEKLGLLAKLNRVGREGGMTDRLRFLRGYLEQDPSIAGNLKEFARAVQHKTMQQLRHDLQRGRLTSLYTHGGYNRIRQGNYNGLMRQGFDGEDIIARAVALDESTGASHEVALMSGEKVNTLKAARFEGADASRMWCIISTFIVAGLPLQLPDVLVEDGAKGFLFFQPEAYSTLKDLVEMPSHRFGIVAVEFPQEYEELKARLL